VRATPESTTELFSAPFPDADPDRASEGRFESALLVPEGFREGEGNRFAGQKSSENVVCEDCLFAAPSAPKNSGCGVSNDDSSPDDPVSTDMAGLSEECELLRRKTTGLFVDGAEAMFLAFLTPFPDGFFSGLGFGWSGEGGCTTT
jgi:hypothetical protein